MSALEMSLLGVLAVVAGVVNTLAGGGSMLLVPTMIFMGLPALSANASLRPAILAQGVFGLLSFRREGVLTAAFMRRVLPLALAAVPSAALAAYFVSRFLSHQAFELTLALVMLVLALLTWRQARTQTRREPVALPLLIVVFILIGFYGGFIQIGVGFLLASALVLAAWRQMAEIHAAKVCIVFCYTLATLPVFLTADQIIWQASIPLILGQSLGGFLGARWAARLDDRWLRLAHIALLALFALILAWRALA